MSIINSKFCVLLLCFAAGKAGTFHFLEEVSNGLPASWSILGGLSTTPTAGDPL